jgi:exonuclease SbcD
MFQFIHAADLHLDSPLHGLEAHQGAPVELLRGATRRALENLVTLAIENRVRFVVIAGDVYDGDWKDYNTGLFFRSQMVRLLKSNIPVFLLAGNHDAASVISKKLTLPENVYVFSTRTAESKQVTPWPIFLHGRGFPNRAVPENFAQDYPAAVPNALNIGVLHTSLTGRTGHDTYAPCSESDLKAKGYQYWALGHVHEPEVVSKDPWIVFAGNSQGRHIRELGTRGCRLVTVNEELEIESVDSCNLDVVRWAVLEVNLAGIDTEPEALTLIDNTLRGAASQDYHGLLAARLKLTGSTRLHGSLHRDEERWRAEILGRAHELHSDSLWIERIVIETSPIYDLYQLAERDPLTKSVVEGLEEAVFSTANLPIEIRDMLDVLPPDIRKDIEGDLEGAAGNALVKDVRAIILEALTTDGGGQV